MNTLIDSEGNSYNVELIIEDNKLFAVWEGEKEEVDISSSHIEIKECD